MTQLSALIEQHRVAYQRLDAAVGRHMELEGSADEAAAEAVMRAAYEVEELARVPLFLYPPANEWESKVKALYIKQSTPFTDGWCMDDSFISEVLRYLDQRWAA
jgi:hypothetical protein